MENFKETAEKCLAGELRGTFVLRNGDKRISSNLKKDQSLLTPFKYLDDFYYSDSGRCYHSTGYEPKFDIVNFIPDVKKEQIKIDIPNGMKAIQETVDGEIRIKFVEKKPLDYHTVVLVQKNKHQFVHLTEMNELSKSFDKKVEVLSKLINIRNYLGKPKYFRDGVVIKRINSYCGTETGHLYFDKPDLDNFHEVIFAETEHAKEAVRILGDEINYLFEPW